MPKFGILLAKDEFAFWSYTLVWEHKVVKVATSFATAMVAFRTAMHEANIRGYYAGE